MTYYDRAGTLITDAYEFARLFEDIAYKRVRQTFVSGRDRHRQALKVLVSTVWLGIDHNCSCDGPPLIFETMVFLQASGGADIACDRYATEAEAIVGHDAMVERVIAGEFTPWSAPPQREIEP
jgi:hypothetical protein